MAYVVDTAEFLTKLIGCSDDAFDAFTNRVTMHEENKRYDACIGGWFHFKSPFFLNIEVIKDHFLSSLFLLLHCDVSYGTLFKIL